MSPRGKKNTSTQPDTTAADGTATTTTTTGKKPRKAPKVALEAKVEFIKQKLTDLVSPAFAGIGAGEFTKAVQASKDAFEAALLLARGLADDWKPVGNRKAKYIIGDFVKTKQKFLELFREMGFGAGPFKVLGVLPSNKTVKIVAPEGAQYVSQNQVEKVTVPRQEIAPGTPE